MKVPYFSFQRRISQHNIPQQSSPLQLVPDGQQNPRITINTPRQYSTPELESHNTQSSQIQTPQAPSHGPGSRPFQSPASPAAEEWKRQKLVEAAKNTAIDELMELVGLERVKEQVLNIRDKVKVYRKQAVNMEKERFNVIFQGNPGTG